MRSNMTNIGKSSSTVARWDWLLFSPDYYSDCYTPSPSSSSTPSNTTRIDEWTFSHLLVSLPTWLLTLLTLIPQNDFDEELPHSPSSITDLPVAEKETTTSSQRSSTPDTDDGYQSASDYSHSLSSQPCVESSSTHPTRLSYAAATVNTHSNRSLIGGKTKQILKNSLATINDGNENGPSTNNNPKVKFIAPRFERMHHAKQSSMNNSKTNSISRTSNSRSSVNSSTRRR